MIALEIGMSALVAYGISDTHVVIKSDNKGVIGAFDNGYSKGITQNRVLQRIVDSFTANNIWLSTQFVASKDNLTDGPSCGCPDLSMPCLCTHIPLPITI